MFLVIFLVCVCVNAYNGLIMFLVLYVCVLCVCMCVNAYNGLIHVSGVCVCESL